MGSAKKVILKKCLFAANNAISPIDRLFVNRTGETFPPIFIVGAPRTGTTLAYQLITQKFRLGYFIRMMDYLFGIQNLTMRLAKPFLRRPLPLYISRYGKIPGILAPAENANYWFQWFPWGNAEGHYIRADSSSIRKYDEIAKSVCSLSAILERPMIFKCVYLSMTIGVLAQVFPGAQFISIRRERLYSAQSILLRRLSQLRPESWWSVKPPEYRRLKAASILDQVAAQVVSTEQIVRRDLQRYALGRFVEVRYEDLCKSPHEVLGKLVAWLKPLGYQEREEPQIPLCFESANRIILPRKDAMTLQKKLDEYDEGMAL